MSTASRPMAMAQAKEICRATPCLTCGVSAGHSCNYTGAVTNAGQRMPTFHEARWKATGYYPFTITDV